MDIGTTTDRLHCRIKDQHVDVHSVIGMGSSGSVRPSWQCKYGGWPKDIAKSKIAHQDKDPRRYGTRLNLLCIPIFAWFGSISLGFGIDRMPADSDFTSVLKGQTSNDICVEKLENVNMNIIGSLIIEYPMFKDSIVSQPIPLRSRLRILCSGQIIVDG